MSDEQSLQAARNSKRRAPQGAAPIQNGARLSYVHAFGVHGPLRNNIEFVTENTVVHPVGQHVCLYNIEDREMQFLQKSRSVKQVLAISVAPKRNVIAVCEAGESGPQVSVFHVATRNRMRTMTHHSEGAFTSCCFTHDSKFLLTMGSAPDHQLVYWKWEQEQMIASAAVSAEVNRVRCSTASAAQITTSGVNHLRLWTLQSDGSLRPSALLPSVKEQEAFVDHCWLTQPQGRMLAVTEQGTVLVFDTRDTAKEGGAVDAAAMTKDGAGPVVELKHTIAVALPYHGTRIETIAARINPQGFLVAGTLGFFGVYEKTEHDQKDPYMLLHTFSAGEDALSSLSVSPTDETVAVYTASKKLLTFPLGGCDIIGPEEDPFAQLVPNGLHTAQVVAMDTCRQKPLLFTVSTDRTCRVWNYLKWRCELVHQLSEEPTSVACHPSGFQLLIGCKERVRMYNVLLGGLRSCKELAVKQCRELRYAHGGHLFACAIGISVQVFSSYAVDNGPLHNFTGHIGPVKRVVWSHDDRFLYSAGMDGGVYGWNLEAGTRLDDSYHVVKQCQYQGLEIDAGERNADPTGPIVACGTDFQLRVIQGGDEKVAVHTGDCSLTALVLSKNNKFLFAGTSNGGVRLYDWPLDVADADSQDFQELAVHTTAVTQLRLTDDDRYLFSASDDGSIFCLLVQPVEGGAELPVAPPERRQFNLDAVLVSQEEVEEMETTLADMKLKYQQMRSDTEYSMHRVEAEWGDKCRVLKEDADAELGVERGRYDELQARHEQYVRERAEEVEKRDADHVQVTQELENQYEHRLATELERYDRLAEEMEAMRQRCEGLLEAQDSRHARLAAEERHSAEGAAQQQSERIRQLHEDLKYNEVKFEEVLAQQEAEYEKELRDLKLLAEKELAHERQNTAMKQSGLTAMKNKFDAVQKKFKEAGDALHAKEAQYSAERSKSKKLEDTLAHFEAHMEERELALDEKERTILSLRSTNRTLDNFRFVLDHRLQQLSEEKGPVTKHIEELERHIKDMYNELVSEYQHKQQQSTQLEHKDLKIGTLTKEVVMLRAYGRERDRTIASFNRELTSIVGLTTPKDIEDAVKDLYRQYVKGERPRGGGAGGALGRRAGGSKRKGKGKGGADGGDADNLGGDGVVGPETLDAGGKADGGGAGASSEAVREVKRQRDYMQKTVVTLKRALKQAKGEAATKAKAAMSENSLLISECNHLRKDGRELRMKLDEAAQLLRQQEQKNAMLRSSMGSSMGMQLGMGMGVGVGADGKGAGAGNPLSASMPSERPSSREGQDSAMALQGGGMDGQGRLGPLQPPAGALGSSGRVIKGSTRPLVEVSSTRSKVSGMLAQLDDNNREIELQRGEIRRLREQVHLLVSQLSVPASAGGVKLRTGSRLDALSPPHGSLEITPHDGPLAPMGAAGGMPQSQSEPQFS